MKWLPMLQDPPDYLEIDRNNEWDKVLGLCPPRFCPPHDPEADHELPAYLDLAHLLGTDLIPWQAYTLRLTSEMDENRRPVWRSVGLSTVRQPGKSVVLALRHALALFREPREQTVFAFQDGTTGRERFLMDLWPMFLHSPLRDLFGLEKNMSQTAHMAVGANTSYMKIWRGGERSQHGSSVALVTMDEAWWHSDDVAETALAPAVLRHAYGQFWDVSTAGEDNRQYFIDKRDQGRRLCETGLSRERGICWIEWSGDDDISDEDAAKESEWLAADPAIGWTSRLADTRHAFHTLKLDTFKRNHLNIVKDTGPGRVIPRASWKAAQIANDDKKPALGEGLVLGLDATPTTRARASVVACDKSGLVEVVAQFVLSRTDEETLLRDWLLQVVKLFPGAKLAVLEPGPLDLWMQRFKDEIGAGYGREVEKYGAKESRQACAWMHDSTVAGRLRIVENGPLTNAQAHAIRSALDDKRPGWVWRRPDTNKDLDITVLVAATIAVHAATHDPRPAIFVGGAGGKVADDGSPDRIS